MIDFVRPEIQTFQPINPSVTGSETFNIPAPQLDLKRASTEIKEIKTRQSEEQQRSDTFRRSHSSQELEVVHTEKPTKRGQSESKRTHKVLVFNKEP